MGILTCGLLHKELSEWFFSTSHMLPPRAMQVLTVV